MRRAAALGFLAVCVAAGGWASAAPSDVAVKVGAASLSVADVARRFAALPLFQRQSLGATDPERLRRFVDAALVPELLFSEAARARGLEEAPIIRWRIAEAYHRALTEALRDDLRKERPITDDEVAAYYSAHEAEFRSDERILIWRILVDDPALAQRILTAARGADGPARWRALAREHSLDAATKMRAGQVGFVGPDGHTDVPQVRVDPALYAAASKVRDGELVAEPIEVDGHLAVIWRRGTRPRTGLTLEEAKPRVVEILERERTTEALGELIKTLRKKRLSEHHPELLESLPEGRGDLRPGPEPSAGARPPAGPSPPSPGAARSGGLAPPEQTDQGLR